MRLREAFAHTAPSPTSTESSTILSRRVARSTGGSPPICSAAARIVPTYSRMSASGLPVSTPSRLITGPWVTPTPSRKRPSAISCR